MTCFTCGHRLQCSYKSVVAMTLLTTSNPINLYRTELNWYQAYNPQLQRLRCPISWADSVLNQESSIIKQHTKTFKYELATVKLSQVFATRSTTSLCTLRSWLTAKLNIPKPSQLYKHINWLTSEKIVHSSFQVPHGCMFSKIRQMMVSNCKWFNHALPFHFQ